jgi:hypothetical protein
MTDIIWAIPSESKHRQDQNICRNMLNIKSEATNASYEELLCIAFCGCISEMRAVERIRRGYSFWRNPAQCLFITHFLDSRSAQISGIWTIQLSWLYDFIDDNKNGDRSFVKADPCSSTRQHIFLLRMLPSRVRSDITVTLHYSDITVTLQTFKS